MKRLIQTLGLTLGAVLSLTSCGAPESPPVPPWPDFPDSTGMTRSPTLEDFNGDFKKYMDEHVRRKPEILQRQQTLLNARYDLADKTNAACSSSKGKPVQGGVRARLPAGFTSWEALAALSPEEIRQRDLFPRGFLPLPHVNHPEGGMVFPKSTIDEVKRQTGRDLSRFDLDFDLPEHLLPHFPPAVFLTTRPDLGDVSQGQLITTQNFYGLFKNLLNEKQLDGLRLLLTPLPQQQFNLTDDRRSEQPSLGVACMDCHINGLSNGAFHLVGDIRPQALRRRIDSALLRGVRIQQLFGSQRALKTVEDFTEFEQRAAYFDGDLSLAAKKGATPLERGSQVHHMSEMQELFDFPPAPKLDVYGRLGPGATDQERRGEALFFGKAQCSRCHMAPGYTDNLMHDLGVERFFTPREINGMQATDQGPTKTFVLRGIKDSPPYLHDGRLLTLDDVVEFFNLILQTQLSASEKSDLLAFLCTL